jgi:hypothetical protein
VRRELEGNDMRAKFEEKRAPIMQRFAAPDVEQAQ